MEHYLAFQRAIVTDNETLVERALQCSDPMDAKAMLNSLRKNHLQEWEVVREKTALEGPRAKFTQNKQLHSYLISLGNLRLGEATQNGVWGVGLTLDDPNILDIGKWHASGNLLGNLLMKVRKELISKGSTNNA